MLESLTVFVEKIKTSVNLRGSTLYIVWYSDRYQTTVTASNSQCDLFSEGWCLFATTINF